jgi:hypothetical protein
MWLCFYLAAIANALTRPPRLWPTPSKAGVDPDALGSIEILLNAPPVRTREITNKIRESDNLRETQEADFLSEINKTFEAERARVIYTVRQIVESLKSSFIQIDDEVTQRVRVKILPVQAISKRLDKIIQRIERLEKSRNQSEKRFIHIALKEFKTAADIYLKKLNEVIKKPKCSGTFSFAETSPMSPVLNLRVGTKAGEIYPRTGTQVWQMQNRRDTVEANERDTILFLTRAILKAGNEELKRLTRPLLVGVDRVAAVLATSMVELAKGENGGKGTKKKSAESILPLTKFNMDLPRILRKRLLDRSELEVDVHPPAEHGAEVLVYVDAITKVEQENLKNQDYYYAEEKRLLLIEELAEMNAIVCSSSFIK